MRASMGEVAAALEPYHPEIVLRRTGTERITNFEFAEPPFTGELKPGVLYIVKSSDIGPSDILQRSGSFLVYNDASRDIAAELTENADAIIIDRFESFAGVLNAVRDLSAAGDRMEGHAAPILESLIHNRGIHHILEIASQLFGNPVVLLNNRLGLISRAGDFPPSAPDDAWTHLVTTGHYTDEDLRHAEEVGFFDQMRNLRTPIRYTNEYVSINHIMSSVFVGSSWVGVLVVAEVNKELSDEEIALCSYFDDIIAYELAGSRKHVGFFEETFETFVADVITHKVTSPEVMAFRARNMGLRLAEHNRIVLVYRDGTDMDYRSLVRISRLIPDRLEGARTTTYKNRVVALVPGDPTSPVTIRQVGGFAAYLGSEGLTAGMSLEFSSYEGFERAYRQARRSIMLGRFLGECEALHDYARYQMFELIDEARRHVDMGEFRNPLVARMAACDEAEGTEYVDTLRAYLENMCNANRTAKAMHLHKNTVLYRVGRMRELFGIDFDDALLAQNLLMTLNIARVEASVG